MKINMHYTIILTILIVVIVLLFIILKPNTPTSIKSLFSTATSLNSRMSLYNNTLNTCSVARLALTETLATLKQNNEAAKNGIVSYNEILNNNILAYSQLITQIPADLLKVLVREYGLVIPECLSSNSCKLTERNALMSKFIDELTRSLSSYEKYLEAQINKLAVELKQCQEQIAILQLEEQALEQDKVRNDALIEELKLSIESNARGDNLNKKLENAQKILYNVGKLNARLVAENVSDRQVINNPFIDIKGLSREATLNKAQQTLSQAIQAPVQYRINRRY